MNVWVVSWNGDQDCGGRNDGPVGVFNSPVKAVEFVHTLIADNGGLWTMSDDDQNVWWHDDVPEALVVSGFAVK